MTYQVLARKYRPHTFQEMVGQEHVLRALINALDQGRLHHAYLFTGTRGVGKTSIARLLAKCLNCAKGPTSQPCNSCDACHEIDQGRFVDLLEVDAASRTKVEDTRELLENVQYAPVRGRFKVYLIDEVHMLSGHSFNALLKTLEEPPAHVKFLLATTDPQRLPVTVLSRCLQFNLKNLSIERIQAQLENILKQEQLTFETPALQHLARAANGSMRDALSLLDQAIAYSNGALLETDVRTMLGSIEQTYIVALLEALAQRDAKAMLATIAQLTEHAADFNSALEELLTALHQIAIAQVLPDALAQAEWKKFSTQLSTEDVQLFYQIGLIGRRDLALAPTARSGFEMVLLRMLAFRPATHVQITQSQQRTAPSPITVNPVAANPIASDKKAAAPAPAPIIPQPKKAPGSLDWPEIVAQLGLTGFTQALASHCVLQSHIDNRIQLVLDATQAPALHNPKQEARLAEALSTFFGQTISLQISLSSTNIATPARLKAQQQSEQTAAAAQSLDNDANIRAIVQAFGATIQPESIQPNSGTKAD